MKTLSSIGTVFPWPAFAKCMTATLCVELGKPWGFSWAAEVYAKKVLDGLTKQQLEYYFSDCLPADDIILGKLTDEALARRWIGYFKLRDLDGIEPTNKHVARLLSATIEGKGDLLVAQARTLLHNLKMAS